MAFPYLYLIASGRSEGATFDWLIKQMFNLPRLASSQKHNCVWKEADLASQMFGGTEQTAFFVNVSNLLGDGAMPAFSQPNPLKMFIKVTQMCRENLI